jgi:hypothetical protein
MEPSFERVWFHNRALSDGSFATTVVFETSEALRFFKKELIEQQSSLTGVVVSDESTITPILLVYETIFAVYKTMIRDIAEFTKQQCRAVLKTVRHSRHYDVPHDAS